ncbi:histidinol-phosphate aminotransferase [Pullulanibacillus pueri]|uniref:Histidinol-phosphate aminotransferase n=1 Tax=Pullulanibacillus pueri TaxID=1437324 RepID=A0A8J2ZV38_9BACL|nr:histidinol-phosphate transaminase [Pullulanibacillus pueri]MBM7681456.1 histidinol-phosphate aminotransferase [Pullulanibacillus pueri]GGH78950.1 histidinol-phosphate aminotransferase [Pullulanibacillus pueri]
MKEQLRSISPYQPGKPIEEVKKEFGLEKVIKLASNENPFGSSPKAIEAMNAAIKDVAVYPDGHATELRQALSHLHGLSEDQFIFSNGLDELIHMLSHSILEKGSNTVTADITFSSYKIAAQIEGAEIKEVPLIKGRFDLQGILEAIDENTGIVWICNPNNPTGDILYKDEFEIFLEKVPPHVVVVSDEAYYEYVAHKDYPDTIKYLERFPNLVIMRTFSKAYGLAGLRIGYGMADANLIKALEPVRQPFNASRIAQKAAIAALDDHAFIDMAVQKTHEGLDQYYTFCEEYGLHYFQSYANFILIDFNTSGEEVFNYLLPRGFIVRVGVAKGMPNTVRITIGSKEENEAIINCLKGFLDEQK